MKKCVVLEAVHRDKNKAAVFIVMRRIQNLS